MNLEHFTQSSRSILVHLKELNYRICRKGLLERAIACEKTMGRMKEVENSLLSQSFKSDMSGFGFVQGSKTEAIKKELECTKKTLGPLQKTIENIKVDVKSRVNGRVYDMWWNRIDHISKRFMKLYSDESNELYDNWCKMTRLHNEAWGGILSDIKWIKKQVFVEVQDVSTLVEGFREGDLESLFNEDPKMSENEMKRRSNVEEGHESSKRFKEGKQQSAGTSSKKRNTESMMKNDLANDSEKWDEKYEEISSEDEADVMNDVLLKNDYEVGNVEMDAFADMMDKYTK